MHEDVSCDGVALLCTSMCVRVCACRVFDVVKRAPNGVWARRPNKCLPQRCVVKSLYIIRLVEAAAEEGRSVSYIV